MKEEHIKKLTELYKNGATSVKEEADFYNSIEQKNHDFSDLAKYIHQEKVNIPENLNEKLWTDFEEKISEKKSPKIWKWSIAASILLLFGFYVNSQYQQQKELEKQAMLEEAKSMFTAYYEQEEGFKKILENELVIIYTKTK